MNTLAIYQDFDGLQRAAKALKASAYFSDVKSEAQAIVKVMAGAELGLPPFASMSGIHIISGKPTLGSNVIATLVKNDPRYDYKVKQADDKVCILTWFEDGNQVGESSFTMVEASNVPVKEKDKWIKMSEKFTWKAYPSDMLFARAISRGARRFAPGIFGGAPVYTPDEMGVDTDEDGFVQVEVDNSEDPEPVQDEQVEDGEFTEPMTIERACEITNSEGEFYSQLSNDKLSAMSIGIGKALSKPDLTPEKAQEYLDKQEAIKVILQARADGSI
jgi:hypothetical protein